MQTITTKLEESRARIVQQGSQFVTQTSSATTAFLGKTKKARERFATDTRKAGELLATEATSAGKTLATGLSAEARMWLGSIDLEARLPALPENVSGLKVPSPRALERDVLAFIEKVLTEAVSRVGGRVKDLDVLVGPQLPATTATTAKAKTTTSNGKVKAPDIAPISGYDDMSAKDVVTRLERMTDEKASAVLAYESANKKRATVLRAAEQRLAEGA